MVTPMRRVMVVGSGGSGKSSFSRQLGTLLGIPVVHLDAHYWRPGWQETPAEEWAVRVDQLASEPEWVIDGNYGGTMAARLARCDTVVFLDVPRIICLWRVLRRQVRFRGRTRPDMASDCPERINREFIQWIWTYPERRRPAILDSLRRLGPQQRGFVLSSSRAVRAFLDDARRRRAPCNSILESHVASR